MLFKDYYKILGFETNKVSIEEIKNGFREQAKKYHPDLNDGTSGAEERFKDINEAYRILSNPGSRRKYDRSWNYNIGKAKNKEKNAKNMKSSDTLIGEAFNMFFGSKKEREKPETKSKKPGIKGDNIETGISVTIEEAFFGASKKISLRAVDGSMKNFTVKIPAGIRNGEKIRLIGQGKVRSKWRKKWRFIHTN
ncbi:MAG: DnaJ domain-containing protein [Clostridia bacterium]|nr:DnaJ domain-containing protein [Clostridia bacterium]